MEMANALALYGAGLSTALAFGTALSTWRRRTKVSVSAVLVYSAGESPFGTPVHTQRGQDFLDETVAVEFTIRNVGGTPVQVLGLLIESINEIDQAVDTHQITPAGLPVVLDPRTSVESLLQKEHIDLLDSCTFLGVVDGSGKRHGVPREKAAALVNEIWRLPTRVNVFQRRDDPSQRVAAFQVAEPVKMTSRWLSGRTRVIAKRSRTLIESLTSGEQPRANRHAVEEPGDDG